MIASAEIFCPDSTCGSTRALTSGRAARAIGGEPMVWLIRLELTAAGAGARQFLRRHDLHELVGGHAAIFFRETEPQQPDLGGLGIELARKLAGLVPFMGIGLDLARHEAAHHVAERLMFRRVERALRPCPLQHGVLPRDYDALIWPAQTCVERLALLCRQRAPSSAAT